MKNLIEWIKQYREAGEVDIEFEIRIEHLILFVVFLSLLVYQCSR